MWPRLVEKLTSLRQNNGRMWVRIPSRARKLGIIHKVHIDSWDHPDSYSMDNVQSLSRLKKLACEAEQSSLSKVKVKNAWNPTSIPHMP
jgi:hypothetical protein